MEYTVEWLVGRVQDLIGNGSAGISERFNDTLVKNALDWAHYDVVSSLADNRIFYNREKVTVSAGADGYRDFPDDYMTRIAFFSASTGGTNQTQLLPVDMSMDVNPAVHVRFNVASGKWQYKVSSEIVSDELWLNYVPRPKAIVVSDDDEIPLIHKLLPGLEGLLLVSGALAYLWNAERTEDNAVNKYSSIFESEKSKASVRLNQILDKKDWC